MVMNTDQVNRYGIQFPLTVLYSVLRQALTGTPMFMSHDVHRPIGWSAAQGIAVHAGVNYLMGMAAFPSRTEEEEALHTRVQQYISSKLGQIAPKERQRLEAVAEAHLRPELAEFISRECASLVQKGIAKELFPHLFPEKENDKRALIPLTNLKEVGPGVFEVGDGICVFAHPYMRRSASRWNNLNLPFLRRFQEAARENSDFDARIALDPDAIGLSETYRQAIELEYWWGPKFSDDLSEIDTRITRHTATGRERIYHRIDRTEFWWYDQNELRAFECEEVVDGQTLGIESADKYVCRYAHSMVDLSKGEPHHLDGAVRIYDSDKILERLDKSMAEAGRHSEYVKLWRADGKIPVPLWKSLLSDYFRDNHLVSEYLGAKADPVETSTDEPKESIKSLLPIEFHSETAPAFLVSFCHTKDIDPDSDLNLICDRFLEQEDGRHPAADLVALDLLKRLTHAGYKVQRPDLLTWVAYEDMHVELPRVQVAHAAMFSPVCRILEKWLRERGQRGGEACTGSIDFLFSKESLRLAFIGAPERLADGFEALASAETGVFDDGLRLLQLLQSIGGLAATDRRQLLANVREDATFKLGRTFISEAVLRTTPEGATVVIPREDAERLEVADAIEAKQLFLIAAFEVAESICNHCQGSYLTCLCEGSQTIRKCEFLGGLLTRHPA